MLLNFRDKMLGKLNVAKGAKGKMPGKKELISSGYEYGRKSYEKYKGQKVSWYVYLIIGIIVVPFAFFGVNYYFQGFSSDPVILEVNDYELTLTEFSELVRQRKLQLEQQMPERMPSDLDIQNAILREIVRSQLVSHELEKHKYTVPDIEVARVVVNAEEFQSDGVFDNDLYMGYLASIQQTRSDFEDGLRERIFPTQLQTAIRESDLSLDHETSLYEKLFLEERKINYVELPYENYYDLAEASTQDVAYMYEQNAAAYMTEETIRVEYIEVKATDYLDRHTASDEEIKAYYEDNLNSYTRPERRTVAHILIDTQRRNRLAANELARTIAKRLEQGEDFDSLVKEHSEDLLTAQRGGGLPPLAEFEIEDENIADAIFSLSVGEFSDPVSSEFGVQIFKLLEIQEERVEPISRARKQIEYEVKYEKAYDDYLRIMEDFEALGGEGKSLSVLAASFGKFESHRTKALKLDSDKEIFAYPDIKQAALDLLQNDFKGRQAVEIEPGHTMYVRIANYRESVLPPLKEIENRVAKDVHRAKAVTAANRRAQLIKFDLYKGYLNSLEDVATEYRLELQESEFIGRDNRDFPLQLVSSVFEQNKMIGSRFVYESVDLPEEDKVVIYEVTSYRQGEDNERLKEQLANKPFRFSDQEYEAFLLEMAEKADIEFYQDRLSG